MTHQVEPRTTEFLADAVERVTFHNVDSGFFVLRVKARGHRDLVTIVGHTETWLRFRGHVSRNTMETEILREVLEQARL